jgi:hypothetical protein
MTNRKPIRPQLEHGVLDRSRRRCFLCVHFEQDYRRKEGQLAHIGRDPSKAEEDDLAYLYLPHHDDYDTKRSQTKNLTTLEIRTARDRLYAYIEAGGDLSGAPKTTAVPTNTADRRVLSRLRAQMDDELMRFLRENSFDGWSFATERLTPLITIASYHVGAEHEFLDIELEKARQWFMNATNQFLRCVATNTFAIRGQSGERLAVPEKWEEQQPERYRKAVNELGERADEVWKSYDDLLRTARRKLGV